MKMKYAREYEVSCNMDDAEETFYVMTRWNSRLAPETATRYAIIENLWYEDEDDPSGTPTDVIDKLAKILSNRVGIQMRMEGI